MSDAKLFTVSAEPLSGVEIPIAPLSVITGKVVDEDGEPLDGVNIMALRNTYNTGGQDAATGSPPRKPTTAAYTACSMYSQEILSLGAAAASIPHDRATECRTHAQHDSRGSLRNRDLSRRGRDIAGHSARTEAWSRLDGADFKLHKRPAYHIRGRANGVLAAGGRGNVQASRAIPTRCHGPADCKT